MSTRKHVYTKAYTALAADYLHTNILRYVGVIKCVAVCCSVLQCVAVCCSVLQCVAVCCSVLQCVVRVVSRTPYTLKLTPYTLNRTPYTQSNTLYT